LVGSGPRRVAAKSRARRTVDPPSNAQNSKSKESIKAAEELALAAFASGLKLAAAFGTVAAKTTSFALESIATGANKFSELVRDETLRSQGNHLGKIARRPHKKRSGRNTSRPQRREIVSSSA